jgi:hypothetical protein
MERGSIKINIEEGKTPTVEVQLANNNLWLTKSEMARLFNCFFQKVDVNLRSIFKNHLLWEEDVSYTYGYTEKGVEKQTVFYNMEVLAFLSYRINSFEAKIFRQFIKSALYEHLQKKETPETKLFRAYLPMQNNYWLN